MQRKRFSKLFIMPRCTAFSSPHLQAPTGSNAPSIRLSNFLYEQCFVSLVLLTSSLLKKFYYRGVKLIYTRRKEIALIKDRIAAGGAPLTRAEFRLIQTQKDDLKKYV